MQLPFCTCFSTGETKSSTPLFRFVAPYRFTPSSQMLEYLPKGETTSLFHREAEILRRLRRALSKDPRIRIVNVRGTGYKLIAE